MHHARTDYKRIQDLTHVIGIIDGMIADETDDPQAEGSVEVLSGLRARLEAEFGPFTDQAIPMDEPVFVIRARDQVSEPAVQYWAALAESAGADESIVKAAREQSAKMGRWQIKQVPDMPPQGPCEVCGHQTHLKTSGGGFFCSAECVGG